MGQSFKDLIVWQRAIELTAAVYQLTSTFPETERFGLTNQLRRASVSVPPNLAEGYGRATQGEYIQFLGHARGSNLEVETQLALSQVLGFGPPHVRQEAGELSQEAGRMLVAMRRNLRK